MAAPPFAIAAFDPGAPDIDPLDIDPLLIEPPDMDPVLDPLLVDPFDIGAADELSGAVVWSVALVPVGDPLMPGSVAGAVVGEELWPDGAVVCASAGAAIAAAAASRMSFMGNLRD